MRTTSGLTIKSPAGSSSDGRPRKPPNVLILAEDSRKRCELGKVLKSVLASDRYAIYEITWDEILAGGWWENTALLVVTGRLPAPGHEEIALLFQFLADGGRLFAWCCETAPFGLSVSQSTSIIQTKTGVDTLNISPVIWSSQSLPLPCQLPLLTFVQNVETSGSIEFPPSLTSSVLLTTKGTGESVVIQLDGGGTGGKAILSQVQFEKLVTEDSMELLSALLSQNLGLDCTKTEVPEYTEGYLLGDNKLIKQFLSQNGCKIEQREVTLEFVSNESTNSKKASQNHLPILIYKNPANFSSRDYFNNLMTKELGRLIIYSDVLSSTQRILTGRSLKNGLVVIARRQTSARGRGKNVWLSPEGCALFSFQLHVDLNSGLGRRISLVQHISALAIILAVESYKGIDLRVKWPNDVYLQGTKVGGILVESQLQGFTAIINIGIGINVANAHPTVCLNSVLQSEPLNPETMIAKVLTEFEKLQAMVEKGNLESFLELYVENWIHNKQDEINVEVTEGKFAICNLVGLDEFGFLRVVEISSGKIFSVQPDGNSFDITNRLIALKS